jgi:hypothetical protein
LLKPRNKPYTTTLPKKKTIPNIKIVFLPPAEMADKVFRNPKTFFMAKKIGSKKVSTCR